MQLIYAILADAVVAVHFACILFILCGLVYIIAGWLKERGDKAFAARLARNQFFRRLHLGIFAFVGLWAMLGQYCPLTQLEWYLRQSGQGAAYPGSFIAYYLERLIYLRVDEIWLRGGAGLLALLTVILYYVYPPWRGNSEL